jgi:hypothetical protein
MPPILLRSGLVESADSASSVSTLSFLPPTLDESISQALDFECTLKLLSR